MVTKLKGRVFQTGTLKASGQLEVHSGANVVRRPDLGGQVRTVGDAAATLAVGTNPETSDIDGTTLIYNAEITANRAVALTTTGAVEGMKWRVMRNASATGAFNVNVGTGPLKALATASTWCEVTFDGTAWFLSANGSL